MTLNVEPQQAKPSRRTSASSGLERPRTGLRAVKAAIRVRGLDAIDRRTNAARHLLAWRDELTADLGGEQTITAWQRAIVELAVRTRLYIDHVDAFLVEQTSLVTRRKKLIPLVEQRQRLADSLVRALATLGLERRAQKVPALAEYVKAKYGSGEPERAGSPTQRAAANADGAEQSSQSVNDVCTNESRGAGESAPR